jgi:hypothetical protein
MKNTTAKQLLTPDHPLNMPLHLQEQVAKVYVFQKGQHKPMPFELILGSPAGAISSSAADMSRFMLAHLQNGELDEVSILKKNTALKMRERPYPDRIGADYVHGFRSGKVAGYTTLEHGGATATSFTSMKMIPSLGLGVFISVNGADNNRAQALAAELILERLIESPQMKPAKVTLSPEEAQAFTGEYMTTRRAYSNVYMFLINLNSGISSVEQGGEGRLVITNGKASKRYYPIDSHNFQAVNGNDVISFELDSSGRAIRYYTAYGHYAFDRLEVKTSPILFWLVMVVACLIAFCQLVMAWAHRKSALSTVYEKWAIRAANVASLQILLCQLCLLAYKTIAPLMMISIAQVIAMLLAISTIPVLVGVLPIARGTGLGFKGKATYIIGDTIGCRISP